MNELESGVVTLSPEETVSVVDVLCESFRDYPVMRFVVGDSESNYDRRLRVLVSFFVEARVFRNEWMIGIRDKGRLAAVAVISRPDEEKVPDRLGEIRESVWADLGEEAHDRYKKFGSVADRFKVQEPHLHVNMIGVRNNVRGKGYGRILMENIHSMSTNDDQSQGVTLTTENEKNISFYEHLGYQVVGTAAVSDSMRSWGFYRVNKADD